MIPCVLSVLIALASFQAQALSWQDLWSTADQQGQVLIQKNQFAKAKEIFERKDWGATAAYRSGDYEHASDLFKKLQTGQGYYNQGNALAHLGRYEQAIDAYNKALALKPKDGDSLYNRKLVKDLLKKDKEKQQNKDQQNKDQQNKDQRSNNNQEKQQDQAKKGNKTKGEEAQSEALREKQQAKEQWLRLIPDDPGGLIREKFLRDHLKRERGWYQ